MSQVRNLALCPSCKTEIEGENIRRENMSGGFWKEGGVHTTMFSCPNCHVILGFAQYTTY